MSEAATPSPVPQVPDHKEGLKGTILILSYVNKVEAQFEGDIKGRDIDIIIRQVMKQYRLWKHKLSKPTLTKEK